MEELQNPGNDCFYCRGKDGADEQTVQRRRATWGCDGPSQKAGRMGRQSYDLGGEIVYRCPLALQRKRIVVRAWEAYNAFKHGILPRPGGLAQQTAFFRWLMAHMAMLENESRRWYEKKKKRPDDGNL